MSTNKKGAVMKGILNRGTKIHKDRSKYDRKDNDDRVEDGHMKMRVTDDTSGETLFETDLLPTSPLDCDYFAMLYARDVGSKIEIGGKVPLGEGNITVTIGDDFTGVRCWESKSYFLGSID